MLPMLVGPAIPTASAQAVVEPVGEAAGEQAADAAEPERAIGRFLALASPIDNRTEAWVKSTALELAARGAEERPVLVLRVPEGTSRFNDVYPLAKFLTSNQVAGIRTVAWVPKTVTGFNAILALACDEIVMHPDAELGDLGRGEALDDDQRAFVLSIVRKQNNPAVSEALALGMVDPGTAVLRVTTQAEDGRESTRLITRSELQTLRQAGMTITKVQTIKDEGVDGLFSATTARRDDYLVTATAESKGELVGLYGLPIETASDSGRGSVDRPVLIRIDGVIDELLEAFLERQIDRAVGSGADLIVFEITSPGGLLYVSEQLATKIADLDKREGDRAVRTVAYVPRQAFSGGTMVALGCDEIYAGPDARIGDAAPIEMRPGEAFERAPEKILSPTVAFFTKLAKRKGRPPAVIRGMIDKDYVVYRCTNAETGQVWYLGDDEIHAGGDKWIKGPPVPESEKGLLVTLDGERAHDLKVAGPPMADFDALKSHLGIPIDQPVPSMQQTWVDTLVFFLNSRAVTVMLFLLGLFLVYLELHFMSGVLAIGAMLCFGLFFWSRYLGGTAGSLEILLFVGGLALIGLEIFVIPGFGVFGLTGGLLVLASIVMASQTFQGATISDSVTEAGKTVTQFGLATVGVILLGSLVGRYLPKMPLFRDLVLAAPGAEDFAPSSVRLNPTRYSSAVGAVPIGATGKAMTTLRPAGKARIGEDLVDVVSEGPYVEPGTPIEVVEVQGNRVVVREVEA